MVCVDARRKKRWSIRKLDSRFQRRRVEITMLANDTRNSPDTMNAHERLSWEEICRRYPDEWVVMAEIEWVNDNYQRAYING